MDDDGENPHVLMDDDQSINDDGDEENKDEPRDELMNRVDDLLNAMNEPGRYPHIITLLSHLPPPLETSFYHTP